MKLASSFFSMFVLAACGGMVSTQNDSGTTQPDSSVQSNGGVVIRTCGPTDGIVHEFSFAPGGDLTCQSPMIADDTMTVTLDSQLTGPAKIDLAPNGKGTAEVCTFVGCQTATQGTLDVTTFDLSKNVASGTYTFTTPDAKVHSASFTNIPICANTVTCG